MKKTLFLAGMMSFLFSVAANAQDSSRTKPTVQDSSMASPTQAQPMSQDQKSTTVQNQATTANTAQATTQEQKKYGNPTVDSILSKYSLVPMPNQLATEQIFPVVGQYQSSTDANEKLTVTLDDQNKGLAWIEGLPQGGKVKAMLKKSPSTYRIPAQKTEDGKDVPEGTLIYDKDTKTMTVLLGRPFDDQDPASVFANPTATTDQAMATTNQATDQSKTDAEKKTVAKSKTVHHKTKEVKKEEPAPAPWTFTGTKIEQVTAAK